MTKRKYIKDSKGTTVSVTTDILGLEKPLLNENYDIDVHNRNMDKIDEDLKPIDDSYIIELFQHDGDTTNPRDYYTKVEADEKFATKEEVENIDLSNLATKEEANNALNKANEAFQRGDNVKTQLVDKLISEGLDVSTNNTFEELINYISIGKKWASGTANPTKSKNFIMGTGVARSSMYIEIPELEFTPSLIVVVACYQTNTNYVSVLSTTETQIYKPQVVSATCSTYISSDMTTCTWKVDANVFSDGKYHIPVTPANLETTWIAYE